MTAITGNTFPVREQLKALDPDLVRWDARNKAWLVPDNKADLARAIVAGAPERAPYTGPRRRYAGRGRSYFPAGRRNIGNYGASCGCEDYPCCGH